jgi:hypothetical protein
MTPAPDAHAPDDPPSAPQADADVDLTVGDVAYAIGWHMDSQRRIYDALLTLIHIQTVNTSLEGKAKELQSLHEQGKFLFPPPWAGDTDD